MDSTETGKGYSRKHATEQVFTRLGVEERERAEEAPRAEEPLAALTSSIHDVLGNTVLQGSLTGGLDGLGAVLHEAMSMGVVGVHTAGDVHSLLANSFLNDWIDRNGVGDAGFAGEDASGPTVAVAAKALGRRGGAPGEVLPEANDPRLRVIGQGGGARLPADVQARMEAAFGHDFSHVRIHTGTVVAQAADALNAHAFAIGSHIYFGGGEFAPGTHQGDHLLAHELAHVVQGDEGRLPSSGGGGLDVSSPTDAHEVEAERVASTVLSDGDRGESGMSPVEPTDNGTILRQTKSPSQGVIDQAVLRELHAARVPEEMIDKLASGQFKDFGYSSHCRWEAGHTWFRLDVVVDGRMFRVEQLIAGGVLQPSDSPAESCGMEADPKESPSPRLEPVAEARENLDLIKEVLADHKKEIAEDSLQGLLYLGNWFRQAADGLIYMNSGETEFSTSAFSIAEEMKDIERRYEALEKSFATAPSTVLADSLELVSDLNTITSARLDALKRYVGGADATTKQVMEANRLGWDLVESAAEAMEDAGLVKGAKLAVGGIKFGQYLYIGFSTGWKKDVVTRADAAEVFLETLIDAIPTGNNRAADAVKDCLLQPVGALLVEIVRQAEEEKDRVSGKEIFKAAIDNLGDALSEEVLTQMISHSFERSFPGVPEEKREATARQMAKVLWENIKALIKKAREVADDPPAVDNDSQVESKETGANVTPKPGVQAEEPDPSVRAPSTGSGTSEGMNGESPIVIDGRPVLPPEGIRLDWADQPEVIHLKERATGATHENEDTQSPSVSGWSSLPAPLTQPYGADLSSVRIHTDSAAAEAADALNARAFTTGNDIYFNEGEYQPNTRAGQELLAHELTHVIQQGAAPVNRPQTKLEVSSPGDPMEQEADRVAVQVVGMMRTGNTTPGEDEEASTTGPLATLQRRAGPSTARKLARKSKGGGASATLTTFVGKKPSARAKGWATFGDDVKVGLQADVEQANKGKPKVHVTVGDSGAPQNPDKKSPTGAVPDPKGPENKQGTPPPTPPPTPTVVQPRLQTPPIVSVPTEATPEQGQKAAQTAFNSLPTRSGISNSAGPRPKVPRSGDADPEKTAQKKQEVKQQADQARDKAKQEVLQGRGPEAVKEKLLELAEEAKDVFVEGASKEPEANDGVTRYLEYGVPTDVEASFDDQQQAIMDASLEEAKTKMGEAVDRRDNEQDALRKQAETEQEKLRQEADSEQRAEIEKARGDITQAREDALAEQEAAVADLDREATDRQQSEVDAMKSRISQDEARIDQEYTRAETQADAKIREAESDAERKKAEEERKSKERSWWDRVKSAVSDVFKAITDALNAIFDAVKKAVSTILDGVKSLATRLIDAATTWITEQIKAFGDWLKSKVTALLGDIFPGIAAKLNEWIDAAVDYSTKAVERIGQKLKNGITALCDWIEEGLTRLLDAFQAAVNFTVTLVEAAMTGDWGKVARMVLEAVLKLAGIPPEEFFAIVGKAEESLDIIVDDPGAFVGNVVDGLGQGFSQFGDNFLTHMKDGFIEWVTKGLAAAGIATLASFELKDIFGFVLDTLGINREYIREKAVGVIGEENVERVEWVMDVVGSAMEGGWDGLWEYAQGYVDGWYDLVIGQITEFIMTRVVHAAIIKIASMFNPVGAIVQAIITVWNVIQFVRNQIQRIWGVAKAIIEGINDLAHGNIQKAADLVESALAKLVPIAIDLLANLLGISGIPEKVSGIIKKLREKVDQVIDKVLAKIKDVAGKMAGKMGFGGKQPKEEDGTEKGADPLVAETGFSAAGESHRLWIENPKGGGEPQPMMASTPMTIDEQIENIKNKLREISATRKTQDPEKAKETTAALKDWGKDYGAAVKLNRQIKAAAKAAKDNPAVKDAKKTEIEGLLNEIKLPLTSLLEQFHECALRKEDGDLEKKRLAFEQKLGAYAYKDSRSNGAMKDMSRKAWKYVEARAEVVIELDTTLEQRVEQLGKGLGQDLETGTYGGRVGKELTAIKAVLNGDGNLNEMCHHVNGFISGVFGSDVLNKSEMTLRKTLDKVNALLQEGGGDTTPVDTEAIITQRKGVYSQAKTQLTGPEGDQEPATFIPKANLGTGSTKAALAERGNTDMLIKDNMDWKRGFQTGRGADGKKVDPFEAMTDKELRLFARQSIKGVKKEQVDAMDTAALKAMLYAERDKRVAKKNQELAAKAAKEGTAPQTVTDPVSVYQPEGEINPQVNQDQDRHRWNLLGEDGKNLHTDGRTQEEHEAFLDEQSKQDPSLLSARQQKASTSATDQDKLPSIRGDLANCVNEAHPWIQTARGMAMPIRAGISGTTDRFVNTAGLLGVAPLSHVRLAMLGYLIPQNAHSFHEIMSAAQRGGLEYKPGDYTYIPPIDGGVLEAMGAGEVSQSPADRDAAAAK